MGSKNGIWKEFTIWKNLSFVKEYKDDKPHLTWKYYYDNKKTQKIESYYEGVRNGNFIEFYKTGIVSKSYYYKNNLLDSSYYEFLPNGSISVQMDS